MVGNDAEAISHPDMRIFGYGKMAVLLSEGLKGEVRVVDDVAKVHLVT